jgi:hypothetical protein
MWRNWVLAVRVTDEAAGTVQAKLPGPPPRSRG